MPMAREPCAPREMADVMAELAMGHKVLVGVDADGLWTRTIRCMISRGTRQSCDLGTGFDLNDPDNPKVIINDSGHPEGAAPPTTCGPSSMPGVVGIHLCHHACGSR